MFGCTNDSIEDQELPYTGYVVENISPVKAKIGDTLKIAGTNLSKVTELYFLNEDGNYSKDTVKVLSASFLSKNENEINLIIPQVYHEKMRVVFRNSKSFKLEIFGMIPTLNNIEHIRQIQVIDKNVAYLRDETDIYKSTDGFYSWEKIYSAPNGNFITAFYYLDENNCWIGLTGNTGVSLNYSNNGGYNTDLLFQVDNRSNTNQINKIQFLSLSKGFFVDNDQEMFAVKNGGFENIYNLYPDLNIQFGKFEIGDFYAVSDDLIFISPNDKQYLVKIQNQEISFSEFDIWPSSPIFFENIGYVQVNSSIYKTTDLGSSWFKIKEYENYYPRIYFLNKEQGFAFVNYDPAEMYRTEDGGMTWKKFYTFPMFHSGKHKDFSETNGLIGSANGKLWKYRKE